MKRLTRESVLKELSAIAFSDFSRFVSLDTLSDGENIQTLTVKDTSLLSATDRRAICSVKAGTKGVEVKLYDKLKALELLGRVCGVFSDKADAERENVEKLKALFEESDAFAADG